MFFSNASIRFKVLSFVSLRIPMNKLSHMMQFYQPRKTRRESHNNSNPILTLVGREEHLLFNRGFMPTN